MAYHLFYKRVQTSESSLCLVEQGSSDPATPQAQLAAAGVTAEESWSQPPQVILRFKRKRGNVAFENLVVAAAEEDEPNSKSAVPQSMLSQTISPSFDSTITAVRWVYLECTEELDERLAKSQRGFLC